MDGSVSRLSFLSKLDLIRMNIEQQISLFEIVQSAFIIFYSTNMTKHKVQHGTFS